MKWEQAKGGKKKRGCLSVLGVIVAVVLIFNIVRCVGGDKAEPLDWPSSGLATMLPEPPSDEGTVIADNEDSFSASIDGISQDEYESYVSSCKDMGYTVEAEESGSGYDAYSEDGYRLSISYYSNSENMRVSLDAPIAMGEISWPTSGVGALLPAPPSLFGEIATDSSSRFTAYIGNMSAEEFASYVDSCIAAGFSVDYNRGDDSFSADDTSGNSVSLTYEGFNTMRVSIQAPDESGPVETTEEPVAPEAVEQETSVPAAGDGSTNFRATMDAYEAFMNEYIDFMKTYDSDSSNIIGMARDYADMMGRYNDFADQIAAIDEDSLSAEDLAYYTEVMNRVNQRLLELG